MKIKSLVTLLALTGAVALQGCGNGTDGAQTAENASVSEDTTAVSESAVSQDAVSQDQAEFTTEVVDGRRVLPVTTNPTGKVLIQTVAGSKTYKYTSYIITSSGGESIVVDGTSVPAPQIVELNPAAILRTHNHPDHSDPGFIEAYPDIPKLLDKVGEISTRDFKIYSIASAHNVGPISENPDNVLMVIEVDGLRIVHMGDCGQDSLSQEQLDQLGEIDIAFTQFDNMYSGVSLINEKGFKIVEQVNPKIIIPTHYPDKAISMFEEKYGPVTNVKNCMVISKEDLPADPLHTYIISNEHSYMK